MTDQSPPSHLPPSHLPPFQSPPSQTPSALHPADAVSFPDLGYRLGYRRALWILIIHTLVLFLLGAHLSLMFFMVPLWITAILVLVFVPRCILAHREALNTEKGHLSSTGRDRLAKQYRVLIALSLPYVIPPGFLFSYPVSDLGFRLLVGNRLQSGVTAFLKQRNSQIKMHPGIFTSFLDRNTGPSCIRESGLTYSFVTIGGHEPKDRHLEIVMGGGFGHWGLIIGSPQFRIEEPTPGVRQMWAGCYRFTEQE